MVDFVDTFFLFFIGFGIGFGFGFHTFDFFLAQSARSLDTYALLFAGTLVFRRYGEDTIGVDVESNFDLRHTTQSGRYTVEVETTDGLIVFGHGTFALQYVYFDRGLVVDSRRENF